MYGANTSEKVAEIRRWHLANGWADIGYHFCIDRDGTVLAGRPLEKPGAHVRGRNSTTIGVCLFGAHGAGADDDFFDHFTPAQDDAVRRLMKNLQGRFGPLKVSGHNEYAAKGCPGFRVAKWLAVPVRDAEQIDPPVRPKGGWLATLSALIGNIFGGRK